MADFVDGTIGKIVFMILGGCMTAAVGLWTGSVRRIRDAKDCFAVFVSQKLLEVPTCDLLSFYESTKSDFRNEVARLRAFLPRNRRNKLDLLWQQYCKISRNDLSPFEESKAAQSFNKYFDVPISPPQDIIRRFLIDFAGFAS